MGELSTSTSITLSLKARQAKLFTSRKRSLLVVEGICVSSSSNILSSAKNCLLHVRPQTEFCSDDGQLKDLQCLARDLVSEGAQTDQLERGSWTNIDGDRVMVVRVNAGIELNRKGQRVIECEALLQVRSKKDNPSLGVEMESNTESLERQLTFVNLKSERHRIFAHWLVETYGKERLCVGSGVLDVAGGNGEISRTLHRLGVPSTLVDPNPRCEEDSPFGILPYPLDGDGSNLIDREDEVGETVRNCSVICGLHPDQATEPIVKLALVLEVPFAILPCCVMPKLFPHRKQKRHGDPVRSYSAFCQYLLDLAPTRGTRFSVDHLDFIGRNKVIYSL